MINNTIYWYMKEQERHERSRLIALKHDIDVLLKKEAWIVSGEKNGTSVSINLLHKIPGARYSDLMSLQNDLSRMSYQKPEWCPHIVSIEYDPYQQTVVLKKEE